ncbi:MAG: hypothetical protein G01um101419_437 [Parcubacteria group bacterium Gr01-1014_19]|nr:MAG: hypothetical protein G01um101419_437 [Parcubacteria group bacterium Gr01-1014_19]
MRKILLISFVLSILIIPAVSLALGEGPATQRFLDIVGNIKNLAVGFLIAISTLFIIYAGFLYVTSAANPNNITQAKDIITYAIIGIVVALLSQVIVGVVTSVLTDSSSPSFSPVEKYYKGVFDY